MKETYFDSENIIAQSNFMLDEINQKRKKWVLETPALLVLDMQKYFLEVHSHAFVPSALAIVARISKIIDIFKLFGFPIIYSKHINTKKNAGSMAYWWHDLLTFDHPLVDIATTFNYNNEIVIEKSQYDAFYETDLDQILKTNNISDVVITGVMTHLCCETTARSAFMRGYKVWFPIDGTATYNIDFHLSSLRNLSHGFANIVLSDEIIELITHKEHFSE